MMQRKPPVMPAAVVSCMLVLGVLLAVAMAPVATVAGLVTSGIAPVATDIQVDTQQIRYKEVQTWKWQSETLAEHGEVSWKVALESDITLDIDNSTSGTIEKNMTYAVHMTEATIVDLTGRPKPTGYWSLWSTSSIIEDFGSIPGITNFTSLPTITFTVNRTIDAATGDRNQTSLPFPPNHILWLGMWFPSHFTSYMYFPGAGMAIMFGVGASHNRYLWNVENMSIGDFLPGTLVNYTADETVFGRTCIVASYPSLTRYIDKETGVLLRLVSNSSTGDEYGSYTGTQLLEIASDSYTYRGTTITLARMLGVDASCPLALAMVAGIAMVLVAHIKQSKRVTR